MEKESNGSRIRELIREKVDDWDDEMAANARFKAFSGQKSDWEPRYLFWRDLILTIAHHFNFIFIKPSELKNQWFSRGGLVPLCLDHVLHLMYIEGDIIRRGDMVDPTSGQLSYLFQKLRNLLGTSKTTPTEILGDDYVILASLLKDRAAEVIKYLSHSHWDSSCIITMTKFHNICGGHEEAAAILSYLFGCGKARYLSRKRKELLEGVKVSLSAETVHTITTLDYDILHLIWTIEKLQQQLDVLDQRYVVSKKLALASLKEGDRKVAMRYARELKITTESREKVASLLNRVEEVLNAIADAESTKTVSEAIQIGARAMKEHEISWEELQHSLQELDESINLHKQVASAIDSAPSCSLLEDEDIEEEFKKFELEVIGQNLEVTTPISGGVITRAAEEEASVSDDSLNDALSNLKIVEDSSTETVNGKLIAKSKIKIVEAEIL